MSETLTGDELKEFIAEVYKVNYPEMLCSGDILSGLKQQGINIPYPTLKLYLHLLCAEGKLELAKIAGRSKLYRYIEPEIGKLGDSIDKPREKLIEMYKKGVIRNPEYKRIAEILLRNGNDQKISREIFSDNSNQIIK